MKLDAPELAALFEVARRGDEPSEADRRRVNARVAQRLAVGAGAGAAVLAVSRFGWASLKLWVVAAVVVAGAGSGAYVLGSSADEHRTLTSPPVAHSPPSAEGSAPALAVMAVEHQPEPSPMRAQPRRERPNSSAVLPPTDAPEASGLARETSALRDANEALRSGAATRALQLLDQFAKEFPNGMLAQEALATRVATLCELGRVTEARSLGMRFVQRYPHSPVAARVRGSCALVKDK